MASMLHPPQVESVPETPPSGLRRKRFTSEEVDRMLETGIFAGQRFELIDGELIDKMGQGPKHASAIQLLMAALLRPFHPLQLRVQLPIQAGPKDRKWSQPEPDLVVVAQWKDDYRSRQPEGNELLIAIEVADTTVRHDAGRKREMYAAASVPEYWVLDVDSRQLLVFRNLQNGAYAESLTLSEGDSAPHLDTAVSELLP